MNAPAAAIVPFAPASAEGWAERILTCWRESLTAILEAGHLLAAAKAALPHGAFGAMIAERLPFSASTADRLMKIAADPKLSNPAHVQHLPPHWGTLYELTKLDETEFSAALAQGVIRPDMERKEAIRGARAIAPGRIEPADSLNFFPTPPWATRALLEHVFAHLGIVIVAETAAWEPACGEGHMAEVLREYFAEVLATDIFDYGYRDGQVWDFLGYRGTRASTNIAWIITNPPFSDDKTEAFVLHALDLTQCGVAMFVRWQWLETVGRYERLFKPYPPTLICPFAERVPLHKGRYEPDGDTLTAYCWLVWVHGMAPLPPFWIPPGCRETLTQAEDAERFTQRPVVRKSYTAAEVSRRYNGAKTPALIPANRPLGFWD